MRKLIVMILLISSISILAACSSAETPTVAPASATEPPEAPAAPTEALQTASLEDILDITWQWAGLVETEPASQSVVPNPEIYTIIFRDDGAVNIQADCNMVGGTYNLEGSALKIELGPSTMAYCGDDSLDQQYLMLLDQVNSFGMEAERLKLADETFRMGFNNGGPAEEPEEPEITTCDAGIDPATVTLDTMGLPYAYKPNCVPGTPYDNSQPPGPTGLSDHIQVNFGVVDPQEVQPNDPIIYIIPVEEYKQLWDDAGDESVSNSIERLQELLQEKPDPVPTSGIPILPTERLMGVSDLQVQGMYLDIYMGSGVRFVTRFSQGPNPVTGDNPRLFYTFQGFSWDGEDLITFFYPVTTSALPTSDSVSPEEQERVDSDPTGYLEEKTTELNALLSSDWEPDLNTLDAMIISLGYGEPREAVNPLIDINWQWAELIETEPAAQSLVPNPLIYTLVFYQDGSLFYQADCNSGSGSYTTDGNQLSIELGVSTLVECGPDSLSNQFITLLGSVESYGFESGRLELGLQGGSGSMIFDNGGPAVSMPLPGAGVPTATTIDNLNVRSGPGAQYPSYGIAPRGTTFEVVGISEDGGWWVVKIPTNVAPDGQGWVKGDYVETANTENVPVVPTPPLDEVEVPEPDPGTPTATALEPINVRSGPGNQYPSYGVAHAGTSAVVIGISEDGGWWVVEVSTDIAPDGYGWVNANYVEVVNAEDVPVIETPPFP